MAPTKGFSWPKIRHFVHICIYVYIFVNVCTYHHTITLFLHHHHWKLESSTIIIICHNHLLHQHNNCHHQLLWDFSVVKFSQFVNCHSYMLLSSIRSWKSSSCVSYAIPCNIMQCLFFLDLSDFGKQFIRISRPVSGIFELSSNPSQTGLEIPPNTVDIHQTYIKNILLLLDQIQQTRSKHTSNIHRKYFASSKPVALEVGTIKTTSSWVKSRRAANIRQTYIGNILLLPNHLRWTSAQSNQLKVESTANVQ